MSDRTSEQTQTMEPDGVDVADGEAQALDIETVTAQRDDYLDQLQRSRADFQNYKRRTEQELFTARARLTSGVLRDVLPVLDDLQRATAALPEDQRDTPWGEGVSAIARKFLGVLERYGVTPIDAVGEPFDPARHEAVATEPGSTQNVVVEVFQPGYTQGDATLRAAIVKVGDKVEMQA